MDRIREAIHETLREIQPATVRQLFYQLVARGVIDKTEIEYKATVGRLLVEMRRAREVAFDWVADNTRWMRKPRSYSSLRDMLESSQEFYRRALWDNQDAYVEVWLEKDALASVVYDVTANYDVPLMVSRGYASLSYLWEAAQAIRQRGKPAYLYYFGDYDPSGCDITRAVEEGIREFAGDTEIHFERVAVTLEQIEILQLPTRPTKKTDSRARTFAGESVELDAIPPATLRALVQEYIDSHIDPRQLAATDAVEREERATLHRIVSNLPEMRYRQ